MLVLLLSFPTPAGAQARPVLHQRLVGQLGPMGAEHALALGVRADLGDPDEPLFAGAHAEAGVVDYTSPIYSNNGLYLEVSPLAFLVLRGTLTATAVWPIGMPGAGYYGTQSPALPALDGEAGEAAHGFTATFSTILQMAVPLGPLRAIAWSELSLEHVRLGEMPFYYSARHDAVLARDDDVLGNWAMALLEIPVASDLALRLGAFHDLRHVASSDVTYQQLGGVAMLGATRPIPEIGELLAFARAGAFVEHERRAGDFTLLAGLLIRYELR